MPESLSSVVPRLKAGGGPGDLLVGLALPFRALSLIFSTRRLLALSALAFVVTGISLTAIVLGAAPVSHALAQWLVGSGGWRTAASLLITVLLYVTLVVAGVLTIPNLLLSPLQDPLSEATEARCGDFQPAAFSLGGLARGTLVSLGHTVSRLTLLLLGFALLLPLNLVPFAGSVAYGVLSAAWAMWWMAAEYLSGPMARHLMPFRSVLRAMRQRLAVCLGFGAALYVLLWVPVLNFFLVPVAVVGGTLLFRALKAERVVD